MDISRMQNCSPRTGTVVQWFQSLLRMPATHIGVPGLSHVYSEPPVQLSAKVPGKEHITVQALGFLPCMFLVLQLPAPGFSLA